MHTKRKIKQTMRKLWKTVIRLYSRMVPNNRMKRLIWWKMCSHQKQQFGYTMIDQCMLYTLRILIARTPESQQCSHVQRRAGHTTSRWTNVCGILDDAGVTLFMFCFKCRNGSPEVVMNDTMVTIMQRCGEWHVSVEESTTGVRAISSWKYSPQLFHSCARCIH